MYYSDGNLSGKLRMILGQTSYDSVVLMEDTGVIRGLPIKISYDSVVLTKDTGVIRGLSIDGDQWKAEKKTEQTEPTNNFIFHQKR